MKKWLILLIVATAGFSKTHAQVETDFELLQIVKVAEIYRQAPNLSFSAAYRYADSSLPDSILEHVDGLYKMSTGRYWIVLDSTEQLQGSLYNLTVYHEDSAISINKRQEYAEKLRLPFMDSAFRNSNVSSLSITEYDDSTRKLTVYFKPGSNFSQYEMKYDKYKFYMRNMTYYLRNVMNDGTGVTSGTAVITVAFSNYSTAAIDQSVFNEEKFIYKSGGQFHVQPAYSNFSLIVNTDH
jgi:hypothetical protein